MFWALVPRSFPGATVTGWKDLQPRLGVVYDLRGDGRTALKVSASRYGERNAIQLAGDVNPVWDGDVISTSRSWFDGGNPFRIPGLPSCIPSAADPTGSSCIAGDGIPQGDPFNTSPNGELLDFEDNLAFATSQLINFFNPDYAFGWGKKHSNWEFSGTIQHELIEGVSLDVGCFRRVFFNFPTEDDRAVSAEDWDQYTFMVPEDPRLPNGGDFPVTLVDLNPAAIPLPNNFFTSAENFGGHNRTWHGFDFNVSARLEGVLLQGGYATGKETENQCELQARLPEVINQGARGFLGGGDSVVLIEHCATETPWISQGSVFGSYTFPYDIAVSAAFFSRQGTERLAVVLVPDAVATAALGRPNTLDTINVNVIPPGTVYGDRLNQLDVRLSKVINFGGGANLRASFDIHNVFNANAIARERYTLVNYLQLVGIQPDRLAKLSAQFNF